MGSFDEKGSQFYSAEIIVALEHLHSIGVIHRLACTCVICTVDIYILTVLCIIVDGKAVSEFAPLKDQ